MLKWLRNKLAGPVYVDCYTCRKDVYDYAKIQSATRFYPGWWKKLKNKYGIVDPENEMFELREAGTMRGCVGFTDLFRKALCIPLWSDIRITIGPVGSDFFKWKYADNVSAAGPHPREQRGDFMPDSHYQHLKLHSPWQLKCDEDVSFLFVDPIWTSNPDDGVIIPPGVLEFKYQHATNINMLIARDPDLPRVLELKYGAPLAFLVPMTERRVVLRHHFVSREVFSTINKPILTFINAYSISRKRAEQCPMKSK